MDAFAEGRTCIGTKNKPCANPIPDIGNRHPKFVSNRCPECRAIWAYKTDKKSPNAAGVLAKVWKPALIKALKEGQSLPDAIEALEITPSAVKQQRARDANFTAQFKAAQLQGRLIGDKPFNAKGEVLAKPFHPSFGDFTQRYFGRTHHAHQILLADTIDQMDPREVVMVLMAPESGKTATIEDYMCRKLAMEPDHRFRVISEARDLSKRIVGTCKARFTDTSTFPEFIARYGPFYTKGQERNLGKIWAADQISVYKSTTRERDYSIAASSWSSAVYGSRIDTLIVDDVQSQKNLNQAAEIVNRIRGTFFNRGIQMRTIIVGTRIAPDDFYDRMLDSGLVSRQVIVPAMGGMGTGPGEPTTPEMWKERTRHGTAKRPSQACCPTQLRKCPRNGEWLTPKEYLDLLRFQSGEPAWWASYMQQPLADQVSVFGRYLAQCFDHDRGVGPLVAA